MRAETQKAMDAMSVVEEYVRDEAYADGTDNKVINALNIISQFIQDRSEEDMEDEAKGLDDNKFLEKFDKNVDDLIEAGEIPGRAAQDAQLDEVLDHAKPGETVTKTTVSKSKDGLDMSDILKGLKLD